VYYEYEPDLYDISFELTRKKGSFSNEDVMKALEKADIFDYDDVDVEHELQETPEVVELPNKKDSRFFNREVLFKDAEFLIKPTPFEVENAVLILGHRIIPFFPEERINEITLNYKKKKVRLKRIDAPWKEIEIYYSLYGDAAWIIYGNIEGVDPERLFDGDMPEILTTRGFNLGAFIKDSGFINGDFIKISISNYARSECVIERFPASNMESDPKSSQEWKKKFESGLKKAIDCQKKVIAPFGNDDLIAAAFFYADKGLLKAPSSSWLAAVKDSKKFALQNSANSLLVWEKGKLFDYLSQVYEDERALDEMTDPDCMDFDEFAELMGFDLTEESLTAYMLDAMHLGKNLDDVKKRCFDGRLKHYPEYVENFEMTVDELWEDAKDTPPELRTMEHVKLRHNLLKLKDRETAFLRNLDKSDFDMKHVMGPDFAAFKVLSASLEAFLIQLGASPFQAPDEFEESENLAELLKVKFNLALDKLEAKFLK